MTGRRDTIEIKPVRPISGLEPRGGSHQLQYVMARRGSRKKFATFDVEVLEGLEAPPREWLEEIRERLQVSGALQHVGHALRGIRSEVASTYRLAEEIRSQLGGIQEKIAAVHRSIQVQLTTFEPEPYECTGAIPVTIYPAGDDFNACVFDINVSMGGETEQEAYRNLKSYILDLFDDYSLADNETLGPEPLLQKKFLLGHVRRVDARNNA